MGRTKDVIRAASFPFDRDKVPNLSCLEYAQCTPTALILKLAAVAVNSKKQILQKSLSIELIMLVDNCKKTRENLIESELITCR